MIHISLIPIANIIRKRFQIPLFPALRFRQFPTEINTQPNNFSQEPPERSFSKKNPTQNSCQLVEQFKIEVFREALRVILDPRRQGVQLTGLLLVWLMGLGVADGLARIGWLAKMQLREPSLNTDSWIFVTSDVANLPGWLLKQHNEHRIFFAKLATLAETHLLRLPPASTALWQTFILSIINIAIIYLIAKRCLKDKLLQQLTWLGCALLLINPWQWETLGGEFQNSWIFNNTLVLIATFILCNNYKSTSSRRNIRLAILVAIPWIAIFNIGQGIAVGLSLCLATYMTERKIWLAISASTTSAFISYFYLLPYTKPVNHPSIQFKLDYFTTILLGGEWISLQIISVSFLILLLYLKKSRNKLINQVATTYPALFIPGIFGLIFALMTTLSRSGFGIAQANSSRYVSHSLMLGISMVLISSVLLEDKFRSDKDSLDYQYLRLGSSLIIVLSVFIAPLLKFSQKGPTTYIENWNIAKNFYLANNYNFRRYAAIATLKQHGLEFSGDSNPAAIQPSDIQSEYFSNMLSLKPMGWHQDIINYEIPQYTAHQATRSTIKFKVESVSVNPFDISMAGWAFTDQNPENQLLIIAIYSNNARWADLIAGYRPETMSRMKINRFSIGFDTNVPRSLHGSPLKSISISGGGSNIEIFHASQSN